MNLQPVKDEHGQVVCCHGCGEHVRLASTCADLDGPAFRAYYCAACVTDLGERGEV